MLRVLLIALALAFGAGRATAQQQEQQRGPRTYSQAQLWDRSHDRITFSLARISLPQRLGAVTFSESGSLDQDHGLDNTIQFRSDDHSILASVYIYYPPIAHPGLAAFMTDRALETVSNGSLRRLGARAVPAGGIDNGAIRMTYAGYHGDLASSAAFMKVGRWLVKFRVSGPEARRADIEATMDALLSSIRFEGTAQPRLATPLNIGGCDAASNTNARPFTEPTAAFGAALILPFDPMGEPGATGRDGRPLNILSRVGDAWCLSTVARYGQSQTPILRAVGPERADGGRNAPVRSVGLALISDSGIILEIVQDQGHYTLIYHRIGESMVLGSYVTPPSDEQLVNLLSGADQEAGRIQARVGLSPDGNSEISLSAPPANNQRP